MSPRGTAAPLPYLCFLSVHGPDASHQGHSVLIPDPRNIPPFVAAIKDFKFEIFCGLNSLFVALLQDRDFQRLDFSNLRITLSGGMALMDSVAHDWQRATGCVVSEGYGMTESSPVISMNPSGHEKIGYCGYSYCQAPRSKW